MPLGLHRFRKFDSFPLHFNYGEEISIILSPNFTQRSLVGKAHDR